jgi:hypothetical protein
MITDIKTSISSYVSDNCDCRVFTVEHIVNAMLVCPLDEDEVVFVGSVLPTDEHDGTDIRDIFLEDYKSQGGMLSASGVAFQIVTRCSTTVLDEETYPCQPVTTIPFELSDTDRFVIAICAALSVLITAILFTCIFVVCLCCRKKEHHSINKKKKHGMLHYEMMPRE